MNNIISTNVGVPEVFKYKELEMKTSFFRKPVLAGIKVNFDQVEGDQFFGKQIHGIKESVVYAYSRKEQIELSKKFERPVEIGQFGENLTVDHLDEGDFFIGDVYEVGSTKLKVTMPRYPCNRFNVCFKGDNIQKIFEAHGRPGVYFQVIEEGSIKSGDRLSKIKRSESNINILDQYNWIFKTKNQKDEIDRSKLKEFLSDEHIPEVFRNQLSKFL